MPKYAEITEVGYCCELWFCCKISVLKQDLKARHSVCKTKTRQTWWTVRL